MAVHFITIALDGFVGSTAIFTGVVLYIETVAVNVDFWLVGTCSIRAAKFSVSKDIRVTDWACNVCR